MPATIIHFPTAAAEIRRIDALLAKYPAPLARTIEQRRADIAAAIENAKLNIERAFDPTNRRVAKRVARTLLRRSAHDGEVRAKYGWLAGHVDQARIGLRGAILLMDQYRAMVDQGCTMVRLRGAERSISRYDIDTIRIALRFIRRRERDAWPAILEALCEPVERCRPTLHLVAAE